MKFRPFHLLFILACFWALTPSHAQRAPSPPAVEKLPLPETDKRPLVDPPNPDTDPEIDPEISTNLTEKPQIQEEGPVVLASTKLPEIVSSDAGGGAIAPEAGPTRPAKLPVVRMSTLQHPDSGTSSTDGEHPETPPPGVTLDNAITPLQTVGGPEATTETETGTSSEVDSTTKVPGVELPGTTELPETSGAGEPLGTTKVPDVEPPPGTTEMTDGSNPETPQGSPQSPPPPGAGQVWKAFNGHHYLVGS